MSTTSNNTAKILELPRLLTVPEVMQYLRVGKTKVYELINDDLPFVKLDGQRLVRVDVLLAYIETKTVSKAARAVS